MKTKKNLQLFVDSFGSSPYKIYESIDDISRFKSESSFQSAYSNLEHAKLSDRVLCVIEGRFGKNNAISVNGRYYGDLFWNIQIAKPQVRFLLKKGLMWQMFGHVERGIEDKDAEKALIAGIVTHLEVVQTPFENYNVGDLFGRAIIVDMGMGNAGQNLYTLLSVGCELSISSRGLGEYLENEYYTTDEGERLPIMNPETYELETFDYTRLPGISDAEIHTVKDNTDNEGYSTQSKESKQNKRLHIKQLIKEGANDLIFNIKESTLQKKVELIKENNMKIKPEDIQQVLESSNAKIAKLTAKLEDAEEAIKKAEEEVSAKDAEIAKIKAAAVPEVDTTNLNQVQADPQATADLEKFKELAGTPEELEVTLIKTEAVLQKCEEDAEELEKSKDELTKKDDEIKEKEGQLQKAESIIKSYVTLGSVDKLTKMVESSKKAIAESRQGKLAQFTQMYSNKKGITLESVQSIIKSSKSIKDAKVILESLPDKANVKAPVMPKIFKTESINEPELLSFSESYIAKAEKRRQKSYTA
jgi:hypothetical protein